MTTIILGAVALLCLLVAVAAIVYAHLTVRGERRAGERKEQLLYSYVRDLLDRNMHLTDGGAFGVGLGATRRPVRDDEPLDEDSTFREMGILTDPEQYGDVYAVEHAQPTVDELL